MESVMEFDFFFPYFQKYETIVAQADDAFKRMQEQYPKCVTCVIGCSECCYALFDLTFIEALYVNHKFNEFFANEKKADILKRADEADRKIQVIKRKAYKSYQEGNNEKDIFNQIAQMKVRCPLLNDNKECELYNYRPITCRVYGLPTSIGDVAYSCGLSGYEKGTTYPTVKMDVIHKSLYDLSSELVDNLKTRYVKMADMLVPVSMALLTQYNEEYLGVV